MTSDHGRRPRWLFLTGVTLFGAAFLWCVEVAFAGGAIGVRDTKANGAGPILEFNEREWCAFVEGARRGEFDYDLLSNIE